MLKRNPLEKTKSLVWAFALLVAVSTTACGTGTNKTGPSATTQGTVSLEAVKVGMPESVFKEAILTFVPDPKGSVAGKVQYLSRTPNANGGQVVAQCKDDRCFGLQVYHMEKPIAKEVALETLKQLFPAEAPPQSRVEDKVKSPKPGEIPMEIYYFGDQYRGELIYTDTTGSKVSLISAWYQPQSS